MSEAPQTLSFQHRFASGALCEVQIDLEAVRDNTFEPRFRWKGRKHKVLEFISWVLSVFATVADRAGVARDLVLRASGERVK